MSVELNCELDEDELSSHLGSCCWSCLSLIPASALCVSRLQLSSGYLASKHSKLYKTACCAIMKGASSHQQDINHPIAGWHEEYSLAYRQSIQQCRYAWCPLLEHCISNSQLNLSSKPIAQKLHWKQCPQGPHLLRHLNSSWRRLLWPPQSPPEHCLAETPGAAAEGGLGGAVRERHRLAVQHSSRRARMAPPLVLLPEQITCMTAQR